MRAGGSPNSCRTFAITDLMSRVDRSELMHVVLDGEASAAQVRELEALLAADAAARAEYDALRLRVEELARLPQA